MMQENGDEREHSDAVNSWEPLVGVRVDNVRCCAYLHTSPLTNNLTPRQSGRNPKTHSQPRGLKADISRDCNLQNITQRQGQYRY